MTNLATPKDGQFYPLRKPFAIGDTTFQIVGKFINTSDSSTTLGKQIIGFSLGGDSTAIETAFIDFDVNNPTVIDAVNNIWQYEITTRGLDGDNTNSASLTSQVTLQRRHEATTEVGIIPSVIYWAEQNTDLQNTVNDKVLQSILFDFTTDVTTGDGRVFFVVPEKFNNADLSRVHARVITAGTTGTLDIQVANVTDGVDMLSTKLTIDSGETGSDTAATPAVIDTTKDDVVTNDLLRIDIDAVQTTEPKGLIVTLEFRSS